MCTEPPISSHNSRMVHLHVQLSTVHVLPCHLIFSCVDYRPGWYICEISLSFIVTEELVRSTPKLEAGVSIGLDAESYEIGYQYEEALDAYENALSTLMPLLQSEPKGERRKLLSKKVSTGWLVLMLLRPCGLRSLGYGREDRSFFLILSRRAISDPVSLFVRPVYFWKMAVL